MAGVSGVQQLQLDRSALADLRGRERATLAAFPLGGGRTADLELVRFSPFAPGARIEAMGPSGAHAVVLPDTAYFRGTVVGTPGSLVLLAAERDRVSGFVGTGGEVYPFGPDTAGRHRVYALRQADPTVYPPPHEFCGNDLHPEAVEVPAAARAAARAALPPPLAGDTTVRIADVAIETDNELRAKFPSTEAAVAYLSNLLAAATAIYERDVAVRLQFSYIRLWEAGTPDPWTATSTSAALNEVLTYWNTPGNDMNAVAGDHDLVHFISGKSVQGGVAYLDVLCNTSYGYGVSQVFGSFDLADPNQVWDVIVFTHELGHNFGSPHSHCYSPPLDECYNQEPGCYSGSVVASRGTLMSYCHLLGGVANIDLVFGSTVSARIGESVAAATCLATGSGGATTTTTLPTNDADGDGIPNDVDACSGTPAGDLVGETGCSVCPCAGPLEGGSWRSRSAFVRCVRGEAKRRVARAALAPADGRSAVRHARQSSCGRAASTRCCLYAGDWDTRGTCRVLRTTACAARAAATGAVDLGSGSCLPSPCWR
ncbi:MAG: zinc-dependent metalloprotease [Candidatus Binatia bacterium]